MITIAGANLRSVWDVRIIAKYPLEDTPSEFNFYVITSCREDSTSDVLQRGIKEFLDSSSLLPDEVLSITWSFRTGLVVSTKGDREREIDASS